jgi:hypothetical protein
MRIISSATLANLSLMSLMAAAIPGTSRDRTMTKKEIERTMTVKATKAVS